MNDRDQERRKKAPNVPPLLAGAPQTKIHTKRMQPPTHLFHLLLLSNIFFFVRSEEPLPPNCNQFYGRQCDAKLQKCVFANSSHPELQCVCYEVYVHCLRAIDANSCMRGAHCKLFHNACTQFYCKKEPLRCASCYAEVRKKKKKI